MRTQIAFALAAASAAATAAEDTAAALRQTTCNAYSFTSKGLGWTCTSGKAAVVAVDAVVATDAVEEVVAVAAAPAVPTSCVTTNAALTNAADIEAAWDVACKKADGTWFTPAEIKGTQELCDVYTAAKKVLKDDWVATDAEKKTTEWAYACAGLDGATSMTTFGVAIVAAIAALAF